MQLQQHALNAVGVLIDVLNKKDATIDLFLRGEILGS